MALTNLQNDGGFKYKKKDNEWWEWRTSKKWSKVEIIEILNNWTLSQILEAIKGWKTPHMSLENDTGKWSWFRPAWKNMAENCQPWKECANENGVMRTFEEGIQDLMVRHTAKYIRRSQKNDLSRRFVFLHHATNTIIHGASESMQGQEDKISLPARQHSAHYCHDMCQEDVLGSNYVCRLWHPI